MIGKGSTAPAIGDVRRAGIPASVCRVGRKLSVSAENDIGGYRMKIESVRIENFRAFRDETIPLRDYVCLVGQNGSGKSTVLHALNVFFRQSRDSQTDIAHLREDDFHHKNTDAPIRITVTFTGLDAAASADLKDYVRQGRLVISAEATYDPKTETAELRQVGSRLGIEDFRQYFDAEKSGAKVADLRELFSRLRERYPEVGAASTKGDMVEALRGYETERPDECRLIASEDQFYGVSRGVNRLSPYVQWVFVSASKDVSEEADESKASALGQLLARTVRSKIDFSEKVTALKQQVEKDYEAMLEAEQAALDELSRSLQSKLREWAHPQASASVRWKCDAGKSVRVEEPLATILLGERGFSGELARFGLGLQRSYLLTLLQELATLESESQPTLIMGIEEPELYQHPPQARHLAEVLAALSEGDAQVLCCSHSPLFIPRDDFEAVRLVKEAGEPCESVVSRVEYAELARQIEAVGDKLLTESGMLAKLAPALEPMLNEMFFCRHLILVEGNEDAAHIAAYMELCGLKSEYLRLGCHVVPVGGKSRMIKPLAIAAQLGLPAFAIFDADSDEVDKGRAARHKKDNRALQLLLGVQDPDVWPAENVLAFNYCMWSTCITNVINSDVGEEWTTCEEAAATRYGHPGGLKKNPLAIAYCHEKAWGEGQRSAELESVVRAVIAWAKAWASGEPPHQTEPRHPQTTCSTQD